METPHEAKELNKTPLRIDSTALEVNSRKRKKKDDFYLQGWKSFFMELKGYNNLLKWEKEQAQAEKKKNPPYYGVRISKKRLFIDLYELDPTEKVIYLGLDLYDDREGHCWPSQRRLSDDLNLARNTIKKYILLLKKKGFIKIEIRKGAQGKRFEYWLLK